MQRRIVHDIDPQRGSRAEAYRDPASVPPRELRSFRGVDTMPPQPPKPPQTQIVTLSPEDRALLERQTIAAERMADSLKIIADRWLKTTGG